MKSPMGKPVSQPVLAEGDRVQFYLGSTLARGTVTENVFRGVAIVKVLHDGGDKPVIHAVASLTKI